MTTDDDGISRSVVQQLDGTSRQGEQQQGGDAGVGDGDSTALINEPEKLRLLEMLFPSHDSSSVADPASTESHLRRRPQPLATGHQRSQAPYDDDLRRHWLVPKHRKRVLPADEPQPPASRPDNDRVYLTIERLHESPRRGKFRRRGKTRTHGLMGQQVLGRRWSPKYRSLSKHRRMPIDVAIRLLGSRARHHQRNRHRSKARRASKTSSVVVDKRGRHRSEPKRHRNTAAANSTGHISATSHDVRQSSSTTQLRNDSLSSASPLSDVDSGRLLSRQRRDVDKKRQRLILEKLLEASMSDAERKARNLTSARVDELLGKSTAAIVSDIGLLLKWMIIYVVGDRFLNHQLLFLYPMNSISLNRVTIIHMHIMYTLTHISTVYNNTYTAKMNSVTIIVF